MKNIKDGKPLNEKKLLELGVLKSETVKITVTVDKELHRKIKQCALDLDRGLLEMITEILNKEFK